MSVLGEGMLRVGKQTSSEQAREDNRCRKKDIRERRKRRHLCGSDKGIDPVAVIVPHRVTALTCQA